MSFESEFLLIQNLAIAYATNLLRSRSDAEDSVQMAAVKALQAFDRFDSSRPFKPWFFRILKNCCLDHLRVSKKNNQSTYQSINASAQPTTPSTAETEYEVDWCIANLNEIHQEILRLRYFADMSYVELADYLEVPKGTVMSRLHNARIEFAKYYGASE